MESKGKRSWNASRIEVWVVGFFFRGYSGKPHCVQVNDQGVNSDGAQEKRSAPGSRAGRGQGDVAAQPRSQRGALQEGVTAGAGAAGACDLCLMVAGPPQCGPAYLTLTLSRGPRRGKVHRQEKGAGPWTLALTAKHHQAISSEQHSQLVNTRICLADRTAGAKAGQAPVASAGHWQPQPPPGPQPAAEG